MTIYLCESEKFNVLTNFKWKIRKLMIKNIYVYQKQYLKEKYRLVNMEIYYWTNLILINPVIFEEVNLGTFAL